MKFAKVSFGSGRRKPEAEEANQRDTDNKAYKVGTATVRERDWFCRFGFVVRFGDSFGSPGRTANVGQATKGTRGIPWHQQPKKDVVDHERPGRAVNRR